MLSTNYFTVLDLETIEQLDSLIGSFLTAADHAAEAGAHSGMSVVFGEFHAADDEAWEDFSCVVYD